MSSNEKDAEPFDLAWERDVPTTAADVEALWRARRLKPMAPDEYQHWCDLVFANHPRTRTRNTEDDEPFEL